MGHTDDVRYHGDDLTFLMTVAQVAATLCIPAVVTFASSGFRVRTSTARADRIASFAAMGASGVAAIVLFYVALASLAEATGNLYQEAHVRPLNVGAYVWGVGSGFLAFFLSIALLATVQDSSRHALD